MKINRRLFVGGLVAAPFIASTGAIGRSLKKITYAAGKPAGAVGEEIWLHAVPHQMGYFAEEGLEADAQFTGGSSMAAQLVAAGRAQVGQANPSTIFGAVQKGAPLKMFCNWTPRYASGLAVLPDGPIKSTKDLAGKLIGVSSLASGRYLEARAMVSAAGLVPDKDVRFVAVGIGAQASTALASKQVHGLFLWNAAYAVIEAQGLKLNIIRDVFPSYEKTLDGGLFVTDDLIKRDPEMVGGYNRAIAKGMIFTTANPEAALAMYYKTWPDRMVQSEQARAADLLTLKNIMPDYEFRNLPVPKFAYFPPEAVSFTVKFNEETKQIEPGLKPEATYTNDFVEIGNKFDVPALEAAARAHKL